MNIVLAHGILCFKRIPILNVEYFNGVKAHLEDKFNARVLVTKVDPVASRNTRRKVAGTDFDGESNIPILGGLIGAAKYGVREVLDNLDITDGLKDLTTSSMSEFNKNYQDHISVKYFCVAGQGRNDSFAKSCIALLPTHAYIKTKTGAEEATGV